MQFHIYRILIFIYITVGSTFFGNTTNWWGQWSTTTISHPLQPIPRLGRSGDRSAYRRWGGHRFPKHCRCFNAAAECCETPLLGMVTFATCQIWPRPGARSVTLQAWGITPANIGVSFNKICGKVQSNILGKRASLSRKGRYQSIKQLETTTLFLGAYFRIS